MTMSLPETSRSKLGIGLASDFKQAVCRGSKNGLGAPGRLRRLSTRHRQVRGRGPSSTAGWAPLARINVASGAWGMERGEGTQRSVSFRVRRQATRWFRFKVQFAPHVQTPSAGPQPRSRVHVAATNGPATKNRTGRSSRIELKNPSQADELPPGVLSGRRTRGKTHRCPPAG